MENDYQHNDESSQVVQEVDAVRLTQGLSLPKSLRSLRA
jgi:hypothetical protein